MTTCLLCTSAPVADDLCVEDGARLWAAREWLGDPAEARETIFVLRAGQWVHPRDIYRARAIVDDINTLEKAREFHARYTAALPRKVGK